MPKITQAEVWESNKNYHNIDASLHDTVSSHIAKPNCRRFYDGLILEIFDRFNISASGSVLELGCGTGSYANLFSGSYTGVDLSEGMIEIARSKFPSGEFVVASVEDFLNQGEKYDLIFSTSFLHHVFDLTEVFDLIAACLNEGGVFVAVHEPLRKDLSSDRTPISEVFDQALGVALGWDTGPLPFRKKVMKSLGVLGKSAFGGAAKINSEFDLVDYQLNYEFNPSLVHNACTKSGLTGHVLIYSYLRFDMIRRFFGGARNYFAFVGVRN